MKEHSSSDRKKLAILGVLGLGLAMASKRRRWQRYAFSQMHAAGGPGGGRGGFGAHGPWRREWQAGGGQLPPMIDAKLRAWHEQEHARAKSGGATPEAGQPQQV